MKPYPAKALPYFLGRLKDYRKILILLLISVALGCFFDKLLPYYFSKIIDVFSLNVADKSVLLGTILTLLGFYTLSIVAFNAIRRLSMFWCQKIETGLIVQTQKDALNYMSGHSSRFFSDQQSGALGTKVNRLAQETGHMFMLILWDFYYPFVLLITTFAMLFWINFLFAMLFLFWVILFGFVLVKSSAKLKVYSHNRAEKWASTAGRVIDILSNNSLVKSFASLDYEQEKLQPFLEEERKALATSFNKIENARLVQFIVVALFLLSMLCLAVFLWYMDMVSTGDVVFMLLLISGIMTTFQYFVFSLLEWSKSTGESENALELLSLPHEITDKPNAPQLNVKRGVIEFKNVFFKYSPRKKVMEDFNLKIKAHEKVGLVGISGSGKSTLVSLLQRLYEVQEGAVLIDGQNINDVTQNSLHKAIAVIPQDTTLLNRSIYDNIAYGRPDATKEEVLAAAKKAYADEFIQEMPKAYDSLVGERGVKVSGGQRQRIAVARAVLKNAPILILDEATSALDSVSEQYIQQSMKSLMRGKTVIAIAHRLSTLQKMDRIIVMSKGKIVEQGTPAELLKRKGTYAKLWKIQTGSKK